MTDISPAPRQPTVKVRTPPPIWLLATGTLVVVLLSGLLSLGITVPVSEDASPRVDWAYVAGGALGVVIVTCVLVWPIFHFAFCRRSGWRIGLENLRLFFLIGFGVALIGAITVTVPAARAARATEVLMQDIKRATSADVAAAQMEMEVIGWSEGLSPASIARDPSMRLARERMAKARAIIAKFKGQTDARLVEIRTRTAALPLGRNLREEALGDVDKALLEARTELNTIWADLDGFMDEMEGLIDVLEDSRGRWQVINGRLMFDRKSDMEAFRARQTKIAALAVAFKAKHGKPQPAEPAK